ncbi:hypothetical protein KCP76_24885 [Salmonella enterica subsp. enterica serovar Weltevreden]|nr:hypothetical protein KCP76_24885 [Salmonella enterica subsp. enterica serovar Weltevreden]
MHNHLRVVGSDYNSSAQVQFDIWLLIRLYVCLKSKMPAVCSFKAMSNTPALA